MSSLSSPDVDLDASTIAHLNFEPVLPCEFTIHPERHAGDEPAMFLVHVGCRKCDVWSDQLICLPGWERAARVWNWCARCNSLYRRSECMSIVRVIGGDR